MSIIKLSMDNPGEGYEVNVNGLTFVVQNKGSRGLSLEVFDNVNAEGDGTFPLIHDALIEWPEKKEVEFVRHVHGSTPDLKRYTPERQNETNSCAEVSRATGRYLVNQQGVWVSFDKYEGLQNKFERILEEKESWLTEREELVTTPWKHSDLSESIRQTYVTDRSLSLVKVADSLHREAKAEGWTNLSWSHNVHRCEEILYGQHPRIKYEDPTTFGVVRFNGNSVSVERVPKDVDLISRSNVCDFCKHGRPTEENGDVCNRCLSLPTHEARRIRSLLERRLLGLFSQALGLGWFGLKWFHDANGNWTLKGLNRNVEGVSAYASLDWEGTLIQGPLFQDKEGNWG